MKPGIDYIGVTVSFYCHDGQGNWLMHKRSNKCRDEWGVWDVGGGKLELGEDLDEAVLREVREEYGVDGLLQERLPPFCIFRELPDGTKTHWLCISHVILVDRSKVIIGEPEKMDELGWFRLGEFPDPHHKANKIVLERCGDRLHKYCP